LLQEHNLGEDARRAQLVAAAEAVRTWVHAQRGTDVVPIAKARRPEEAPVSPEPDLSPREPLFSPALLRWAGRLALASALGAIAIAGGLRGWNYLRTASPKREPAALPAPKIDAAARPALAPPPVPAKPTGNLSVQSNPPGALILLDGKLLGTTPTTVNGLSTGSHALVLESDKGSVRRTVSIAADATTDVNESIFDGWLHVSAPFEVQAGEGGRALPVDARNQILLTPGFHDVQFENRALGYREIRRVEIKPGWTTAISLKAPKADGDASKPQ
jgi:hypothetical protein